MELQQVASGRNHIALPLFDFMIIGLPTCVFPTPSPAASTLVYVYCVDPAVLESHLLHCVDVLGLDIAPTQSDSMWLKMLREFMMKHLTDPVLQITDVPDQLRGANGRIKEDMLSCPC